MVWLKLEKELLGCSLLRLESDVATFSKRGRRGHLNVKVVVE